jgi:CDGSH-type Zn-finger protein
MEPVTVQVRENGPLILQAPVRVLDHLGNEFPIPPEKPTVALCRCGQSARKPFCDGSHKRVGFQACDNVAPVQPITPVPPAAGTP